MLWARRRAAGSADAAVYRYIARYHHSDLGSLLSRPLRPWRGGYGNSQSVVAAGPDGRDRRQHHRALRAGAAVQDRVRGRGVVGRHTTAAGARVLEVWRGPSAGSADEGLRLLCRASLHADGDRRRIVLGPADDLLWPADPSGGGHLLGPGGADLDPRRARLYLRRLAGGGTLSRRRRAAIAVCDRLRLADRRRAGDADQPFDRAARSEGGARDVETYAGNRVRQLSLHRRGPICDQPAVSVGGMSRISHRIISPSRKYPNRYRAECSSAPCPRRCAAIHRPRSPVSAS